LFEKLPGADPEDMKSLMPWNAPTWQVGT